MVLIIESKDIKMLYITYTSRNDQFQISFCEWCFLFCLLNIMLSIANVSWVSLLQKSIRILFFNLEVHKPSKAFTWEWLILNYGRIGYRFSVWKQWNKAVISSFPSRKSHWGRMRGKYKLGCIWNPKPQIDWRNAKQWRSNRMWEEAEGDACECKSLRDLALPQDEEHKMKNQNPHVS